MKSEGGRARFERDDFYVLPADSARPAGFKRLERGFFGGEACGIMLCRDRAARVAVGPLARGKNALGKARRARQHFMDATDFDNVYADGNNHGKFRTQARGLRLARA